MPDKIEITVKVNGKCVPLSTLSDETITKIKSRENEENAPVFSTVGESGSRRLIVKLNHNTIATMEEIIRRIKIGQLKEGHYSSFEPSGFFGVYDVGHSWDEVSQFYSAGIPKPLFPEK